jgi:hypothetical protein
VTATGVALVERLLGQNRERGVRATLTLISRRVDLLLALRVEKLEELVLEAKVQ